MHAMNSKAMVLILPSQELDNKESQQYTCTQESILERVYHEHIQASSQCVSVHNFSGQHHLKPDDSEHCESELSIHLSTHPTNHLS